MILSDREEYPRFRFREGEGPILELGPGMVIRITVGQVYHLIEQLTRILWIMAASRVK